MFNPQDVNPFDLPSRPLKTVSSLPSVAAYYFLISGNSILSIGMTGNLEEEWMEHQEIVALYNNVQIHWYQVNPKFLSVDVKNFFIEKYTPLLNSEERYNARVIKLYPKGQKTLSKLLQQNNNAALLYMFLMNEIDIYGAVLMKPHDIAKKVSLPVHVVKFLSHYLSSNKIIHLHRFTMPKYLYCLNPEEVWKSLDEIKPNAAFYVDFSRQEEITKWNSIYKLI